MKNIRLTFLFTILISLVGMKTFAHDIEVNNTDGVTIYYVFINDETELAVTYKGSTYTSNSKVYTGNVVIPESVIYEGKTYRVTRIGNNTFYNCSGLNSTTIPNSVITIGDFAFSGCKNLNSITIPNSVTTIGYGAFQSCSSLTSINIPSSVTSIRQEAFYNCSSLDIINIPNSLSNIGSDAFEGSKWYKDQPEGLVYAGKVAYKYKGTMPDNSSIKIEEGTVGIAGSAFVVCSGLTSITIPNSVKIIGGCAFYNCTGLTSVTIPSSVTSIGYMAFKDCNNVSSVIIPNSVMSIESGAFSGCKVLASINIPNSVTIIENGVFSGCSSLTSITIPNSVTSINESAFDGCSNLSSIIIPNNVTTIGKSAFQDCSSLLTIVIGSGIESIGSWAFSSCSKITDIYCYAIEVPNTEMAPFINPDPSNLILHVPSESIEDYNSVEPWKSFKSIESLPLLIYKVDGEIYKVITPMIGEVIVPEPAPSKEGYTFSGWSEIPETMPAHDVTVTGTFEKAFIPGDANGDGLVNVTDIVSTVNFIMEKPSQDFNEYAADLNDDGVVNVTDIVKMVNIIMEVAAREMEE